MADCIQSWLATGHVVPHLMVVEGRVKYGISISTLAQWLDTHTDNIYHSIGDDISNGHAEIVKDVIFNLR